MKTLNEFLDQQMQDPEFKKEYEKIQPEMDIIRAIVDARVSNNLTQKELVQTATFCGQQGRISRTVRAILNGQPGISAGQRVLRPTDQY